MREDVNQAYVVGDLHGILSDARYHVNCAVNRDIDTVLQLGDFGIWQGLAGRDYLVSLNNTLHAAGVHLYFVDGNHENFEILHQLPLAADGTRPVRSNITHLPRGLRWTWNGVHFLAMGGAHSVDRQSRVPGVSWWPQEHLTNRDIEAGIAGGPVDVMVTHDSPASAPNAVVDRNDGHLYFPREEIYLSGQHRQALDQVAAAVSPRQILHGHYHEAMFSSYVTPAGHTCQVTGFADGIQAGSAGVLDLAVMRELYKH